MEIKKLDEELMAAQVIKVMTLLMDNPGWSKRKACEELGYSYDSITRWIREGKLTGYLSEIHDERSDIAQIAALGELQSIVLYQARIARGEASPRGANPTAAAQFVLQVATLGARTEQRHDGSMQQINIYVPEMKTAGAPMIDAPAIMVED